MKSWVLLLIMVAIFILYSIFMYFYQKKLVKPLSEEEFKAGYRKAQLIDIREADVFKGGHILGSRNIPLSQLRARIGEIRNDQPVYLYDQNGMNTGRAGMILKKNKIKNLYQLKGGFKDWKGKIKKK